MAYNTSNQRDYYQDSSKYGSYQFVSLYDIIESFMAIYVGEEKIISKASRLDVAFFAQRALAEMSFDTFKSIKSQQITLPNTQIMPLPHDYVNYTKISSVDASGVKHLLYPTRHTNNPFQIRQIEDGSYDFPSNADLVTNSDFATGNLKDWSDSFEYIVHGSAGSPNSPLGLSTAGEKFMYTQIVNNALEHVLTPSYLQGQEAGSARATWQKIDTTNIDYVDVEAQAVTTAALAGTTNSNAATTASDSAGNVMSSANNFTVSTGNYYALDSGNSGGAWLNLANIIGNEGTSNALDIPHSEIIKLNQSYYKILKSIFPNNEVDKTLSWALYVKPGTKNPAVWHNHFQEEHKSKIQVSGICYLTKTDHGTEFANDFFKTETVPVLDHWYIWPSQLGHRPKEIKNDKPRWIIATNTVFK